MTMTTPQPTAGGSVFKRCYCKKPVLNPDGQPVLDANGRPKRAEVGISCPQLRRADGRWNPRHGSWSFQLQVPAPPGAHREHIRQSGHASEDDARAALDAVWRLLQLADKADVPDQARTLIATQIRAAIRAKKPLPDEDALKRRLLLAQPLDTDETTGDYLTRWIAGKKDLDATTHRTYSGHITRYLIPHLGEIPLARLRPAHLAAMFAAIEENSRLVAEENANRRIVINAARAAWHAHHTAAAKAARAELKTLPPFRPVNGPATRQRIRATLRSALSDAVNELLITLNPAKLVKLAPGKRPKGLMWTDERVARWRTTGEIPSPVMVWTPAQTAAFLRQAIDHPWFALYHLIAYTGLRRGEACGVRWTNLDLKAATLTVAEEIVQLGWDTLTKEPKSDAGARDLPLDTGTVTVLTTHRIRQNATKTNHGDAWIDTGLVFTQDTGAPLHPSWVTTHFQRLTRDADLPPIRLHDLRHGAASHALAAGIDIKVVQELLGHSSSTLTRDTYTTVVTELKRTAAQTIAHTLDNA